LKPLFVDQPTLAAATASGAHAGAEEEVDGAGLEDLQPHSFEGF
jgi:hypothetical protein